MPQGLQSSCYILHQYRKQASSFKFTNNYVLVLNVWKCRVKKVLLQVLISESVKVTLFDLAFPE